MNVNNLTTLIISLMVCGLVVGATVPMITAISSETTIEEYNSTDDASWIRMAYGTADYDLEYTLADDTITVGTQSGTADDMILYADEKSCVMSVDGEFVIVNGYIENPEVIKADAVTVTRSAGTITITDGTDTIVSTNAPAWAYYPAVDGTYAFFDASVEGVKVKSNQNMASVGTFAGVMAYNNFVVAPNGAGDLGMTQDAVITDNVIDSIKWAVSVAADDLSLTSFEPGSITLEPLEPSIIDNPITSGGVGLMSADPSGGTRVGDLYYTFSGTEASVLGYASTIDWVSFTTIPDTVTYNDTTYTVTSIGTNAFKDCTNLALTSLPAGLTSIFGSAFKGCTNLALTSLPAGITSISSSAFDGCTNLALTSLPAGLTKINSYCFQNCTNLALTSLPAGITLIDANAFDGCTNLALTSLPAGVTTLGANAFNGCTGLKSMIFLTSPNLTNTTGFVGCTNLKEVLNLGEGAVTTTSYGMNADEVRSDVPAFGYVAPLSNTVIVQKEGAIFDVLSLLPLVAGIGLLMVAVIYALEKRYV